MTVRPSSLALRGVALAATANALHPIDRHGRLSFPAFAAGLPVGEFAGPLLAVDTALTAAHLAREGVGGRRGAAALGLAAANAAGLLALHHSATRAEGVYEQALVDELGSDYRDAVAQPDLRGSGVPVGRDPGYVRTVRVRRRFAQGTDLSYGPAGPANLLDVWRRADLPLEARAPVLVQVPGGAWITGDKHHQAYPLLSHLVRRGWVCVAVSYRLSPGSTWPDQIVDIKRALAWVKQNIAAHGGDPGFVAITGGSAGGHLSSLAALTPDAAEWQPGFEDADTSVAAAVPYYGAYDWLDRDGLGNHGLVPLLARTVVKASPRRAREVYDLASPMSRIHPDAPPFLISHGVNDSMIPVEEGRAFATRLRAVSHAPVVYAELPGAQHAFDVFGSVRARAAARAVSSFLGWVYGRHLAARNQPADDLTTLAP